MRSPVLPLVLILVSATGHVAAQQNYALDFQPLNTPYIKDHLRLERNPEVGQELTVEFWMRADDSIPFCPTEGDPQGCWSTGDTWFFGNFIFDGHQNFEQNPGRDSFDVVVANSGRLKVVLDPGNSETDGVTDVVTGGSWRHVAVVREWVGVTDHRIRIYVDGQIDGEQTYSGRDPLLLIFPYWGTERADWAGAGPDDFPDYHGLIDEIRYWSVARTQAEIQATMSVELTGAEPGLVHYLRLNEGQGALANDMVSDNDGILFNLQPGTWVPSDAPITQQPGPDCGDGVMNQDEQGVDCGGVCPPCPPLTETSCANGVDDDFDGSTDCEDPDCAGSSACQAIYVEADDRDADYNPLDGVMLGNFYNRSQICIGDDGSRWWQAGLQFRVSIAPPVTVTSAVIELTSSGDNNGSTTTEIRGIDQDDVAPFVAGTQPSFGATYPLTDGGVTWSPDATAAGTTQPTPELRDVVQEILDRPGWTSGNFMGFVFLEDRAPPQNWRCFQDSFADDGNQARLRVEHYAQGAPVCLDARNPMIGLRVFREPAGGCPVSPGSIARDFVFGSVAQLALSGSDVDLGAVRCVTDALGTTDEVVTSRDPDPSGGDARFYLMRRIEDPDFGSGFAGGGPTMRRYADSISCP